MTRGRKKDHTIPESRALAAQRSYRDRKAKYVADLEERCAAAEAEVVRLREELEEARRMQGSTSVLAIHEAHELIRRCSEMLGHLSSTSQALARFQDRLMSNERADVPHNGPPPSAAQPSNLDLLITAVLSQTQQFASVSQNHAHTSGSSSDTIHSKNTDEIGNMDTQSESESECCGGFIDCSQLPSENIVT